MMVESSAEVRRTDGGRSVMSSESAAVGSDSLVHREADFGCVVGRIEPFLRIPVIFLDNHITMDYGVFLPLFPGGDVCFLFVCFSISLFNNPVLE